MTADDKRAKMVERVRALFAKAASSEFEAEAEVFEAKALKVMAEYEIEERELRDASSFDEHLIDLTSFGNAGYGAAALACWMADLFGAYAVLWSTGDGKRGRVKVMATASQREQIDLMLDHLLPQLRQDLSRDKPRSRKSYSIGWARRVAQRLREAQVVVYSQSSALVPTSTAAEEAFAAAGHRAFADRSQVNPFDAQRGDNAGAQADLNQRKVHA